MADLPSKPAAQSFSAGINKEQGLSPLQWSDKCFLCGAEIGETDPRGFYTGTSAMMLCHRGCLNIMTTHGGKPADYHRAMEAKAPSPPTAASPPSVSGGPDWLEFPTLAALQTYTRFKGEIPSTVKVTVAGQLIQGQ